MVKDVAKTWIVISLITIALCFSGCGNKKESYSVSNGNHIILRLAETQPSNYPSARAAMEFARLVEQKSAGRIKVKVYDSGKLGDETSVVEQVQFGGIDLARVSLSSLAKYSVKAKITMLPYIFRSREHMWQVFDGPIGADINDDLYKEKILCLAWYEGGARSFYNAKKQINSIEDLKGLKISVQRSQTLMDMYSILGVSLVPTQSSGIYNAIQTGFIDGAEGNVVAYYTDKHYETAKYLAYDEHTRIPEVIIASRVATMQLSKTDRAIIEKAARESADLQRRLWLEIELEAFRTFNNLGIVITYADGKSKAEFLEAVQPFYNGFKPEDISEIKQY